ncbi:unnamed protein product [Heligmosomoides polygyrus]|uniref:Secreted protein n=1 Tax=Heligmosomoides polygyrus TaxID=6339 RepID=A0A183GDC9_HELPZ|nr:unnamed protein product [Heligmosomoides polygyrus]
MLLHVAWPLLILHVADAQLSGSLGQRNSASPPQSIQALSSSQLIFLNTLTNLQQPGTFGRKVGGNRSGSAAGIGRHLLVAGQPILVLRMTINELPRFAGVE